MTFPCQTDPFNKYFWRTKNLPGQRWLEHSPNTRESRRLGQTLNQGLERKDDCAKARRTGTHTKCRCERRGALLLERLGSEQTSQEHLGLVLAVPPTLCAPRMSPCLGLRPTHLFTTPVQSIFALIELKSNFSICERGITQPL